MSPEKDNLLCEKYPKIFKNRNLSPKETCMCWGFECGDGWFGIIDTLCFQIQHYIDQLEREQNLKNPKKKKDFQIVADQVKEKFGGLRFYYTGGDDFIAGIVRMAEGMSYKICETCGLPGDKTSSRWVKTLCVACDVALKEKREMLK